MDILSASVKEGTSCQAIHVLKAGRYMVLSELSGTAGQFQLAVAQEALGELIAHTTPGSFSDLIEVPEGLVYFSMGATESFSDLCSATVNLFDLTPRP